MLRRAKAIITIDEKMVEIVEPSAKELDEIIEIVNSIDKSKEQDQQMYHILKLTSIIKKIFGVEVNETSAAKVLETVIDISCYDIEGKKDKNITGAVFDVNQEGYLLNELDLICKRYGKAPQELYSELSYNQIHYLYAVAYNNYLDELDMQCSLAGATRKTKPTKIILKGLEFMEGNNSRQIQKEAKRNRILNNRKHGEGLNNV